MGVRNLPKVLTRQRPTSPTSTNHVDFGPHLETMALHYDTVCRSQQKWMT